MKKYTPKQLAKELNIENKQEMRNILRDYKDVLSCDYSTPQYYRSGKDNTLIKCGCYKTYDDDDLIKLRQIIMFKQLGVKPSEIIEIMKGKEKESAIDKLIGMLEEREKEIKEQLFMARQIKGLGGMKSVWTEAVLFGKTPHQYATEVKEAFHDKDVLKMNIGLLSRAFNEEELENYLKEMGFSEIPEIKEYLVNEFNLSQKKEKFDSEFSEKLRKMIDILSHFKMGDEDEDKTIQKSIRGFMQYMKEEYGIAGVLDFGFIWMLYKGSLLNEDDIEDDQWMIVESICDYIPESDLPKQEYVMATIMFEFENWIGDCIFWMVDALDSIFENRNLEASELICSYVCDKIGITNHEDLNHFELYLKTYMEKVIREQVKEEEDIEEEDIEELESVLSKFYGILHECLNNA